MAVFIVYTERKEAILCVRPLLGTTEIGFSQDQQHNSSTSAHIHELYLKIDFKSYKLWLITTNTLLEIIASAAKTEQTMLLNRIYNKLLSLLGHRYTKNKSSTL